MINGVVERVKTGIKGMDELMEGGFPRNRTILLSGGCGTGKSIFSTQYIYNGVTMFDEPGLYVSLDESPELLREDVLRFGWNLRDLEKTGKFKLIDGSIFSEGAESLYSGSSFDIDVLLQEIMKEVKNIKAKRLVIDSIPGMGFKFKTEVETRHAIMKLNYLLQRTGVTTILISELNEATKQFGKYGVEEYLADGVITLHYLGVGTQSNRTMHIRKMRSTKHSEDLHPMKISDKGITVHKIEDEYKKV